MSKILVWLACLLSNQLHWENGFQPGQSSFFSAHRVRWAVVSVSTCGALRIGPVPVKVPRVCNRGAGEDKITFTPSILLR
ncbi:hypothetical protein FA743_19010 [Paracoccus gahaiensis]|uniref:Uncharacterized protein n=1 Tax=Paracoccus gahaiensis TaxID=1706839 RepID=A0A4U0R3I9_9RHOB|nr:hypothetical protein FA743_19010 [Paracoccus gahaiensis]